METIRSIKYFLVPSRVYGSRIYVQTSYDASLNDQGQTDEGLLNTASALHGILKESSMWKGHDKRLNHPTFGCFFGYEFADFEFLFLSEVLEKCSSTSLLPKEDQMQTSISFFGG